MCYGFGLWWIFPLACFGLMLLGMILFYRLGRRFCCHLPKDWFSPKDPISKGEHPEENQNKTGA